MSLPMFEDSPLFSGSKRPVRARKRLFDVPASRRVVPLLARIVEDVMGAAARIAHLDRVARKLEKQSSLDWPDKKKLFAANDEQKSLRKSIAVAREELEQMGVQVLDSARGMVGFPTIVNGSLAYLVYHHDDQDVLNWRYRDQPKLRAIPESWRGTSAAPFVPESEGLLV